MLTTEIQVFTSKQNELKKTYPNGGFVVIYQNNLLGVWNNRNDALKAGITTYGNIQFLVTSIFEQARTVNFTKKLNS